MRGLLVRTDAVAVIELDRANWTRLGFCHLLESPSLRVWLPPTTEGQPDLILWHATDIEAATPPNRGATALMEGGMSEPIRGTVFITGRNPDGSAVTLSLAEVLQICARLVRAEMPALPPAGS